MFYSQTFLARKGPLGTVWCAAHLQHRLKKSHYTATNIPSTVDRIMFPEVPIALRMSGHLLLGVVRIYSKKVDYLYHDCNVVLISLRKAFATTVDVNLPEDATHAPAHTVTLPEKLDLDALDLDDLINGDRYDNHLRSYEEITLTEQIAIGRDIYVAISFDEDILMDSRRPEEVPDSGVRQTEDVLCAPPVDADVGLQDPALGNQTEVFSMTADNQDAGASNQREPLTETVGVQDPGANNDTDVLGGTVDFREPGPSNQIEDLVPRQTDHTSPQNFPEIEIMRDAAHDVSPGNLPPLFLDRGNDGTEPFELSEKILNEKETHTPILENVLDSGGQSFLFQHRSEPPASAVSQEVPEVFDTRISFGHSSPALAIRSTPPVQQKKPRGRKRNLIDKSIVLPNKFMKKSLEDYTDILRKKRNMPSSHLGVWKLNNHVRKEQVLQEPILTGLCDDLFIIFKKDYISSKPHLVAVEEDIPEPVVRDSLAPESEAIPEPMTIDSPAPEAETILHAGVVQSSSHTTETLPEPEIVESPNHAPGTTNQGTGAAHSSIPVPEIDMEIERLRNEESNIGNYNFPEYVASPLNKDDFTPFSTNSLGSESVPQAGTTIGSLTLPTPDVAASTGTQGSELETPRTLLEEQLGLEYSGLSDIPELINSAEAEDLGFLEADNNTPTRSQASQGVDSLSVRTRAVAQYLKQHSPITPFSEDPSASLSLNKILAGKTRKICARMFFETLVLKSHGLIDVQQDEPYGDINIKLTALLSKSKI